MSELEKKLSSEVIGFSRAEEGWNCQKVKDKKELEGVQKELNEKSKVLQEYQDKVHVYTHVCITGPIILAYLGVGV